MEDKIQILYASASHFTRQNPVTARNQTLAEHWHVLSVCLSRQVSCRGRGEFPKVKPLPEQDQCL